MKAPGKEAVVPTYLSIVIPAYNEERRLPATLEQITAFVTERGYPTEIIVVDDGSSDATAAAVEQLQSTYSCLQLLRNDHRGKGYAVRSGVLAAQGKYVLLCDADLAVPIEAWDTLHQALEQGFDVVIGSREGAGSRRLGEPRYRHVMGRIFNLVVQAVAVPGIQDTQCGFKVFHGDVAHTLFSTARLYGEDAARIQGAAVTAFDVEVLFLARKLGYRIKEVPVLWRYGSETKVAPLRDSWRNLADVLRVRWNDLRGRYDTVTPSSHLLKK